jgi:hypothetical protein
MGEDTTTRALAIEMHGPVRPDFSWGGMKARGGGIHKRSRRGRRNNGSTFSPENQAILTPHYNIIVV